MRAGFRVGNHKQSNTNESAKDAAMLPHSDLPPTATATASAPAKLGATIFLHNK